jgi:tetratricopeptide (TPR) repeat protein
MKHPAASQTPRVLLHATFTSLIGFALIAPAFAQDSEVPDSYKGAKQSSSGSRTAAGASERGRERKQKESETEAKQAELYPLATRKDPNIKATNKGGKALREIIAAFDAKKADEVIAKVEALTADSSMNAYDKGFAYQIAASVEADRDPPNHAKAVDYYQKAIATDGLDNNGHYQMLYNLAVVQNELEKYADSLASLDRFLNETKTDKPEMVGFKAYLLSQLERPAEAAVLYEQILAKNPNDKSTLMNAVALYQQAGNDKRVKELLDSARSKNMLTTDGEYRTLYVPLINAGKLADAVALIDEGIAKGAIKPSQKLANDYSVIAQTYYGDENTAKAIEMYKRAAAASENGEAALNLARVLRNENRIAEAKQAAQEALNKGLKKPEDAKKILALPGK